MCFCSNTICITHILTFLLCFSCLRSFCVEARYTFQELHLEVRKVTTSWPHCFFCMVWRQRENTKNIEKHKDIWSQKWYQSHTPLKINGWNHNSLEVWFRSCSFLFFGWFVGFQPLIFQGVSPKFIPKSQYFRKDSIYQKWYQTNILKVSTFLFSTLTVHGRIS